MKVMPNYNYDSLSLSPSLQPASPASLHLDLKRTGEEKEQEEEHESSKDISMMILVPYVSFLIAESFELSGFLALIISAITLSLYGRPNMHPSRAQ